MADPLSILSVAASITQFLDLGYRLIKGVKEIHDSAQGALEEVAELKLVAEDIKNLNQDFTSNLSSSRPLSKDDIAIRALAGKCNALADELLRELRPLTLPPDTSHRMLQSARVSIRHLLAWKDIVKIRERLSIVETQLRERVARATQKDQRSSIRLILDNLRRENEDTLSQSSSTTLELECEGFNTLVSAADRPPKKRDYDITLNALHSSLVALLDEGRALGHRQSVIQSLSFKAMKKRQDQIDTAHFKTLDWAFDRSKTTFVQWLEERQGLYWVNGQAGSGKSTLMKYLSDHQNTRDALHLWAGEHKLFIASFYFWNAGVDMQKSQLGLLQSILHQIFRFEPRLVGDICPEHQGSETWAITELMDAFSRLGHTAPSAKFCLFIDGLDEYDGEEVEIIRVLKSLARSKNFKICASSRPWMAFEEELSCPDWMFVLQDFTKNDMKNYVKSTLLENDKFKSLAERDPRCNSLIPEISQRAKGVWLWVFLVVRDLLRDITSRETYDTLEKRLDSLPQELNEYFSRIMDRIDPFFRVDTARIFLIAVESVRPFPLFSLSFLKHESRDRDYALNMQVKTATVDEISAVCADWRPRLQTRCGDLLSVQKDDSEPAFFGTTVDFIHRTARDFLRDNHHIIFQRYVLKDFCGKKTLSRMLLAMLKAYPIENFVEAANGLFNLVDEILYYTYELEQMSQATSQFPILDDIDAVMSIYARGERNHWTNGRDSPTSTRYVQWTERGQCNFLALTIQARLRLYVQHVLDADRGLLKKKGRPLLDYALRPTRVTPSDLPYSHEREYAGIEKDLVSVLLDRDADPNEIVHIYGGRTPWQLFVLYCYERCKDFPANDNPYFDVARLLIHHRVDLDQVVHFPPIKTHAGTTARYKTEITIETSQAPARELLSEVFTSKQMMDLESTMQQVNLERQRQNAGWLGWISDIITGKASTV
ncbi:hypothetical protein EN45_081780 [Penicillium chrysogenum]|uniref:Pc21g20270 protein n=2 Tax=Penicillium chrysogenum species complex TaxID=254878 RepID=B6HKM2_PENRW|nr:hypothetical protein EN45_081780 [Penicillium chrysogenum]CAP96924.1 Pc21g20270 [Penicillium rubens Wisconsin 54-1255]